MLLSQSDPVLICLMILDIVVHMKQPVANPDVTLECSCDFEVRIAPVEQIWLKLKRNPVMNQKKYFAHWIVASVLL